MIAWPERQKLETRAAMAVTPTGAKSASYGTVDVSFATSTDLASRTVTLSQPQLVATHFPTLGPEQTAAIEERVRTTLAGLSSKTVPLDMVVASLRDSGEKPPSVPLKNDPPAIFVSARPASLIVFDGEPVLAPIAGTPLSFAVNTNWDIFFDNDTKTWYWLNNGGWLTANDVKGPWSPAPSLPPAFSGLPSDASFAEVKKQIPGRRIGASEVPAIFVSTVPAEIIVTQGPPQFVRVPGTALEYVRTPMPRCSAMSGATYYYLVSGRWFSAPRLDGPWTFATAIAARRFRPHSRRRPARLRARLGARHAAGAGGADRGAGPATGDALEGGGEARRFLRGRRRSSQPIAGTTMSYAVNTSFNVVQAESAYYACYQGAWFMAPSPAGAWTLAASIPPVIYTIPPGNPLYPCTYVRVYAATPDTVTYGYTAGYTMGYVSAGVVVYGTGWYYPPYIYPGADPDLLSVPVFVRGRDVLQPGHGRVGTRRRDLRSLRRGRQGRHRVQPEDRSMGARRRRLRSVRRRGRDLGVQPDDRRLCPRQRGVGTRRRVGQRELVQRAHRRVRHHEPEQQRLRALGIEHVRGSESDGPHAKPERRARLRRVVHIEHRRGRAPA